MEAYFDNSATTKVLDCVKDCLLYTSGLDQQLETVFQTVYGRSHPHQADLGDSAGGAQGQAADSDRSGYGVWYGHA